jgi:hypothetical protein
MPRQTFNSFWYGNELSPLEWACLNSFVERGHRFRLFCYDLVHVPKGVFVEDASRIIPKDELFLVDGNVAAFSDLFRYKVIQTDGDWWADTDVYCLTDDIPDCDYAWANEDQDNINGAILRFPSEDSTLFDISRAAQAIAVKNSNWCDLGPHLLTRHLIGVAFDNHFGNRAYFYPIHWLETFLFWLPGQSDYVKLRCKDSFFVHFWSSMFSQIGIDRYARPPIGSFLGAIYSSNESSFRFLEPDVRSYTRTVEIMKAYFREGWVKECSERKLGYDVSGYPFDDCLSVRSCRRPNPL